VTAAV